MSIARAWIVVVGVLAIGMIFSVADYRRWKTSEYGRFGQGPQATTTPNPSLELNRWYQNKELGFRLAYPETWHLSQPAGLLLKLTDGTAKVEVTHRRSQLNIADEITRVAATLPPFHNDREYINTDTAHLTVITWNQDDTTFQRAYVSNSGVIITIDAEVKSASWNVYEKTFWKMYESVIVF